MTIDRVVSTVWRTRVFVSVNPSILARVVENITSPAKKRKKLNGTAVWWSRNIICRRARTTHCMNFKGGGVRYAVALPAGRRIWRLITITSIVIGPVRVGNVCADFYV